MTTPDRHEILVSLQDRSLDRRSAGCHLAAGVLLTPEHAVFDLLPELELRREADLEVLIAPAGAGEHDVIERLRPTRVVVRSLDATPHERVALVPLAHPSRYGSAGAGVSRDVLLAVLERAGSIWPAMIEAGLAARPLAGHHPVTVLDHLDDLERRQRRRLVQVRLGRRPGEIVNCPWFAPTECGVGGFFRPR